MCAASDAGAWIGACRRMPPIVGTARPSIPGVLRCAVGAEQDRGAGLPRPAGDAAVAGDPTARNREGAPPPPAHPPMGDAIAADPAQIFWARRLGRRRSLVRGGSAANEGLAVAMARPAAERALRPTWCWASGRGLRCLGHPCQTQWAGDAPSKPRRPGSEFGQSVCKWEGGRAADGREPHGSKSRVA